MALRIVRPHQAERKQCQRCLTRQYAFVLAHGEYPKKLKARPITFTVRSSRSDEWMGCKPFRKRKTIRNRRRTLSYNERMHNFASPALRSDWEPGSQLVVAAVLRSLPERP